MNAPAKNRNLGLMAIISSMELEKSFIKFKKSGSRKQEISKKKAMKDSVIRMEHQCASRQQFRRKTTPNR